MEESVKASLGKAFSLSLERERFLNLEVDWDIPGLRNFQSKNGCQGVRGAWEPFRKVMSPLGGAGSEGQGGGCSELIASQGRRTGLNLECGREALKSSELE